MKTKGLFISAGIALSILEAAYAQPVITAQPQSQTNAYGTTATFTVQATGTGSLACQWQADLGSGFVDSPEGGVLINCTLTGNSAGHQGGGAIWSTLYNCIVYFNTAANGANYYQEFYQESRGGLNYCCTTPLPTNGLGNIDADPRFVNAAAGDLRLRPDSPCIDTGANTGAAASTDIAGLPLAMDGNNDGMARVDMGAYEFNPYRFEPTLSLTADGFRLTIRGEPGKSVRIERSPDLVHWEYAGEVPIPASGQTLIDPAATSEPMLFDRATRMP